MIRRLSPLLLPLLLGATCAEGELSPPANHDPDAAPVTEGDWYRPTAETSWQWQLQGAVDTRYDVEVYDVDLFDVSDTLIRDLQADGRRVICYFSAGSAEDWRPDYDDFLQTDLGDPLGGWPGEVWVDVRSANVFEIMLARLDLARARGCDGVEPDNVDAYTNRSGFDLSATDQLAYNKALSNAAHARGLSVGLKNDLDQVVALLDFYDFSLNEQCHEYDECALLSPFVAADKPVFNAEYAGSAGAAQSLANQVCPASARLGLMTLVLPLDLDDSFRVSCP